MGTVYYPFYSFIRGIPGIPGGTWARVINLLSSLFGLNARCFGNYRYNVHFVSHLTQYNWKPRSLLRVCNASRLDPRPTRRPA